MEESKKKQAADSDLNHENNSSDSTKYNIELPLEKDMVGKLIKELRKIRKYSQTTLGRLIGVQKAQVSKIEKAGSNITIGTLVKVLQAMRAKITLKIELDRIKDIQTLESKLQENKDENK